MQEVPEGKERKETLGGRWQFIGLMPPFDPPRHDSSGTIRKALNLGVNVKMITGTIMTISKDRVKPSPMPDSWKLAEIFATGIILGSYLAMMTVLFFWAACKTDFFPGVFGVSTLEKTAHDDSCKLASAVYLQVSIISQALIFVTRSRSWSYVERPGLLLVVAFAIARLIAFTRQKDFGMEQRELQWAHGQRTLHGLQPPDTKMFIERTHFTEING